MSKIVYITSKQLLNESEKVHVVRQRASMVHELICSYNLDKCVQINTPRNAKASDLQLFHSGAYVSYLKRNNDVSNGEKFDSGDSDCAEVDDEQIEYGLGYDCPKIQNLWQYAITIAGATLTAVEAILNEAANIAINWCGGWHHAQRDEAEGFCYVNDIGIGIQRLREKFQRIFYIDMDVHHGDGVENGFAFTKHVFTLSFHQQELGFFPGTGLVMDCGMGAGRGYSANFPYKSGVSGAMFVDYFMRVTNLIFQSYKPDICVVQCGGDVITGDPLGGANLTPIDLGKCIAHILAWDLPKIFLGGGGYNCANTARYWTYLTAIICGQTLSDDIPDNEYFLDYGPGYELNISSRYLPDHNTVAEFNENFLQIQENLTKYKVGKN